jgi:linoleoyl-CoA desaturase
MSRASTLKFPNAKNDFFATLNKRVNDYFKSNQISKHANASMVFKTIFMFSLYFIPYALIISGTVTSMWAIILLVVVMGLGTAGIGLSIMHDANHGAYSTKPWINNLLGYSLNLVGANAFNWKVQHNVLHHTYTNVYDADEDISPRGVLRMSPYSKKHYMHRFQHIYAWVLYGLMTIVWLIVKDFKRLSQYNKDGLVKRQKTTVTKEWAVLIFTKIFYIGYIFVLPIVLTDLLWWQVVVGFFIMHFIAGFILAIIFQPAHVIDGTEYPEPDTQGNLEDVWAIHQLRTTTNFANNNRILSWYVGGLNYQVEHHLFPHVCHVHYRSISKIVKATAEEYGLPYKSEPTFISALVSHAKLLKELGSAPELEMVHQPGMAHA